MNYKEKGNLTNNTIQRSKDDEKESNDEMEFDEIIFQLENNLNYPDILYKTIPELYNFLNTDLNDSKELLDKIIKSGVINSLFEFAKSDPSYVAPFLDFISHLSDVENCYSILNQEFLDFLISQIDEKAPSMMICDIAEILSNFSQSNPIIASRITEGGAISKFINILHIDWDDDLDDDQEDIIKSIITFFGDILDIEKFQPTDYFSDIVDSGFYFLESSDDITSSALRLLQNASEGYHYLLFEPLILNNLESIHKIFLMVDSDDEELSSLSFNFLLNITKESSNDIRYEIFDKCKEDLMDHLTNSIEINENNSEYVLKFVYNMIESKIDEDYSSSEEEEDENDKEILLFFFDFLKFYISALEDDMDLKLKVVICHIFAKITQVASDAQKLELVQEIVQKERQENSKFISNLCSFFGISQKTDYDLVCTLYNLLQCVSNNLQGDDTSLHQHFIKSFIDIYGIEELSNLFEEPEDQIYITRRDHLIDLLKDYYQSLDDN